MEAIKCPECAAAGANSFALVGQRYRLQAAREFVDASGTPHTHDYDGYVIPYRCSRGHTWTETVRTPCDSCGLAWRAHGKA